MEMCRSASSYTVLSTFGWFLVVLLATATQRSAQGQAVSEQELGTPSRQGGGESRTRCYDDTGRPQRCIPGFENAAFNVRVDATNTCGEDGPNEFCVQTGNTGIKKSCEVCYGGYGPDSHPASHLTDFNNNENQTWWQSETMFEGIQYPNQVNLTLHLRKAFDITYVRLWFYSPRPESFAIYKRASEDGPWTPYQFYSATCRDTYGLPDISFTRKGIEETRALCTAEYSDISPLRGGNVAFSTLEGRPSAYSFDNSPELQEWVTATDIMITLDRLNTFGDEVFGDPQVLRSYFYAISDFAVGARCKCNGHASDCVQSSGGPEGARRVCLCEHNTAGPDCNECLPFYNDAPWGRASALDSHECRACNCNGFSTRCFFDKDLFDLTAHGGHCLDCMGNRDGPNCERCRENYYTREDNYCIACNCNEIGSRSLQCNSEGRCQCKPGVTGDKCDRCASNHYDFGTQGCKPCGCNEAGSYGNKPSCDQYQGTCQCKENVEGKRCGGCKPGFFNLDVDNIFGCTPCFCYGHTSRCSSAAGYSRVEIESVFARGNERWTGQDLGRRPFPIQYQAIQQVIGISSKSRDPVFFVAPDRFLGDQRASYNQDLTFKLRIGENGPVPTVEDIIIEGAGLSIAQAIFGQRNPLPHIIGQDYKFHLHENSDYGWQPRLTSRDFMSILSNLTAIKIRGTYTPEGVGFLDDVKLATARRGAAGRAANWIETCECLVGYVGQFCESCAPGYRHEPSSGGPFAPCVPCNCNGHADICDAESGRCICQHNTGGDNCERCGRGYYGNALQGTAYDCKLCPCPNQGACTQLLDETVVCLECPKGYGGPRCDLCSDGFFGDPTGRFGPVRLCQSCDCNQNVDANAVGNCNRTTGECLKCIYNTGGPECDQCVSGFYGDALALPQGDCKQCQCYRAGTLETGYGPPVCDQLSGQCQCRPHILGKNCEMCQDGFFNIQSGEGCQSCNCDSTGSVNATCDLYTGQCTCQPGITGLRCDMCQDYQYGFSSEGCQTCECDQIGSLDLQCDPSGQCPCLDNVEGRQCERCKENKYDRQRGCVDCPACYNLVQTAADDHRERLKKLEEVLGGIASDPTVISDADFERKLADVQKRVEELWDNAKAGAGSDDKSLLERLNELRERLVEVGKVNGQVMSKADQAAQSVEQGQGNVTKAEEILARAMLTVKNALDYVETDGSSALQKAIERSQQFGQQSVQMSTIAREARLLAQEQEEGAEKIRVLAEKALNTSTAAYELAKDSINQQKNISDELRVLRNEIDATADKLELAKELTRDVSSQVNTAYETSLDLFREIKDLVIPDIDTVGLRDNANATSREGFRIKEEAEEVIERNDELLSELDDQNEEARELLERAMEQQQMTDELLADTDAASHKAQNATNMGDQTLKEAQQTYNTLQEFDAQVQNSKDAAQDALAEVPQIRRLIEEAENKTQDAQQALAGAVDNAQNARDTAQEAQQKYAEQASTEAELIRKDASQAKADAGQLRDEADALAGRVAVTENRVKHLEEQAVGDEVLTTQAKSKVGQAKSDAAEATKQVSKALLDVQGIIDELQELPDLDEEALNELEKRLMAAEEEFNAANLDDRMEVLRAAKIEQTRGVKDYQEEVDRLKAEVRNIEAIRDSLPDGCWKRLKLEP